MFRFTIRELVLLTLVVAMDRRVERQLVARIAPSAPPKVARPKQCQIGQVDFVQLVGT